METQLAMICMLLQKGWKGNSPNREYCPLAHVIDTHDLYRVEGSVKKTWVSPPVAVSEGWMFCFLGSALESGRARQGSDPFSQGLQHL